MAVEEQCQYLRQLVHDALSKHLYNSAVFFADKLVSMGGGSLVDIFSLAQVGFPGETEANVFTRSEYMRVARLSCTSMHMRRKAGALHAIQYN